MKSTSWALCDGQDGSPPARGAWVEISAVSHRASAILVAPHTGGVG